MEIISKYLQQFIDPSVIHESLFVGSLWKNPTLYSKYKSQNIIKSTFTEPMWYFYYFIGLEMFQKGARQFEDTVVFSFITSKPNEKNKKKWIDVYDDYGGFDTIQEIMDECESLKDKSNDEFHFSEVRKFEILRNMQDNNLIDSNDEDYILSLTKMTLKELQRNFQYKIKEAFIDVNAGDLVIYNLTEDIVEAVEELDAGEEQGMPLFESPRLNKKINGLKKGNLIYLVLSSGVGKSSFVTEKAVLSAIKNNEKMCIFVNEEGKKRWQGRLLATVASRILKKPVPRDVVNRGHYTAEYKATLLEAAKWLKDNNKDENIKLIVLKKYRVDDVVSYIELLSVLGYRVHIMDTFKPETNSQAEQRWLAFSSSAQELYDCIKEETNNCSLLATVQMKIGKEYRYIDLESIGKSLEITEVAAVVLAGRMIYSDEYDGKNKVFCYNYEKDEINGKWMVVEYHLDPKKKYLILFIPKNREGGVDEQIVFEVIPDLNIWKEVAYAAVENKGYNKG